MHGVAVSVETVGLVDRYTVGWVLWLLAFAWLEGRAVLRKAKGDTLTEHLYRWLHLASPKAWAGRGAMALLLLWLTWHFLGGVK